MGKVFTLSGALFLFLLSVGQFAAQSVPQVTLVKASRLLDPRTGNVLAPAAVLIEDNKIKEVGPPSKVQAPSGAKIIDLGRATLLPGLIDSHTHLLVDPILPAEAERARHLQRQLCAGAIAGDCRIAQQPVLMGAQLAREDLRVVSRRCATLDTPGLTAMLRCGM